MCVQYVSTLKETSVVQAGALENYQLLLIYTVIYIGTYYIFQGFL